MSDAPPLWLLPDIPPDLDRWPAHRRAEFWYARGDRAPPGPERAACYRRAAVCAELARTVKHLRRKVRA